MNYSERTYILEKYRNKYRRTYTVYLNIKTLL